MNNQHLIGRQRLKVKVTSREMADRLFGKAGEIIRNRLNQRLEEIFDELPDVEEHIHIDTLRIDIGELRWDHLEEDLVEKTVTALSKLLQDKVRQPQSGTRVEKTTPRSRVELLHFFLTKGYLPWWEPGVSSHTITSAFTFAMEEEPNQLRRMLTELSSQKAVRKRVLYQLEESTLVQLNEWVWATSWKPGSWWTAKLTEWTDRSPNRLKLNVSAKKWWLSASLIHGLLSAGDSPKLDALINLAASLGNLPAEVLTTTLWEKTKNTPSASIDKRTINLREELEVLATKSIPEREGRGNLGFVAAFRHFLMRGYWRGEERPMAKEVLEEGLREAWQRKEPSLLRLLDRIKGDPRVISRLLHQFSPAFSREVAGWSTKTTPEELYEWQRQLAKELLGEIVDNKVYDQWMLAGIRWWLAEAKQADVSSYASFREAFMQASTGTGKRAKAVSRANPKKWEHLSIDEQKEAVIAYCETGKFNWLGVAFSPTQAEVFIRDRLEGVDREWEKSLLRVLGDEDVRRRLHRQFSRSTLLAIHALFWREWWPEVQAYLNQLRKMGAWVDMSKTSLDHLEAMSLAEWLGIGLRKGRGEVSWKAAGRRVILTMLRESHLSALEWQAIVKEKSDDPEGERSASAALNWSKDIEIAENAEEFALALPARGIELLRRFLRYGYVSGGGGERAFQEMVDYLAHRAAAADDNLRTFLRLELSDRDARRRLSRQIPPEVLLLVIDLLAPTDAAAWRSVIDTLSNWYPGDSADSYLPSMAFEVALYDQVLDLALGGATPDREWPSFLLGWLKKMEVESHQPWALLATLIWSKLGKGNPDEDHNGWVKAMEDVWRLARQHKEMPFRATPVAPRAFSASVSRDVHQLADWLTNASSVEGETENIAPAQLMEIALSLPGGEWKRFITQIADHPGVITRLLETFPVQTLDTIIERLASIHGDDWRISPSALYEWWKAVSPVATTSSSDLAEWRRPFLLLGLTENTDRLDESERYRRVLDWMAGEMGVDFDDLLEKITEGAKEKEQSVEIMDLLERIKGSLGQEDRRIIEAVIKEETENFARMGGAERMAPYYRAALLAISQSGETPWWVRGEDLEDERFRQSAESDVEGLLAAFTEAPDTLSRLLPFLRPSSLQFMVEQADENLAPLVIACVEVLGEWEEVFDDVDQAIFWRTTISALGRDPASFPSWTYVNAVVDDLAQVSSRTRDELTDYFQQTVEERKRAGDPKFYSLGRILEQAILEGPGPSTVRKPSSEKQEPSTPKAGKVRTAEPDLRTEMEWLQRYLLYGTLPPAANRLSQRDILRLQWRILERHPALARKLYLGVLRFGPVRSRFFAIFDDELFQKLARLLWAGHWKRFMLYWEDIKALLPGQVKQFDERKYTTLFHRQLISFAALRGTEQLDWLEYLRDLLKVIADFALMPLGKLVTGIRDQLPFLGETLQEDWAEVVEKLRQREADRLAAQQTEGKMDELDEAVFIHNSGLVILAPFLQRYFSTLNMLEEGRFRDETTAVRAVHLLQFLVSGQQETPEHLLVFNKVLCGLPLSTPVPLSIEVTEEEEEITGQLLNSVLQNWEKMGNSTVENLRASFLLREGRLLEKNEHWELRVENKGYDLLLQYLPWTISIISLPWVEKRIEVNWEAKMI